MHPCFFYEGGHPLNWQGVLEPSLSIVKNFTQQLCKANGIDIKNSSSATNDKPKYSAVCINFIAT